MDEGSQCREPESIAPLSLASPNTKLVIAGDSYQVGPALLVLGEEARENGLKYSLLERLCCLYKNLGGAALKHIVSLNNNYRCHASIMQLPNHLFYENQIAAHPLDAKSHPHFPYPLVFVCSSLDCKVDCELEAKVLLEQLQRLVVDNWPTTQWGGRDLTTVCLVSASRTQMVRTRAIARREYASLQAIRMLVTYTLQGQEFRALFMSTTEPVDDLGRTTNPTKSPCDRYVFNTVLTRSKSLVVVVGSPYSLLRIEQHMTKDQGMCWNLYMRCCIENKTFIIPPSVECSESKRTVFCENLKTRLYSSGQAMARPPRAMAPLPVAPLLATEPKSKSLAVRAATNVICKSPAKTITACAKPQVPSSPLSSGNINTFPIKGNQRLPQGTSRPPTSKTNVGAKTRQPLAKEKSCTSRISSTPPVYVLKPEQPFKRASSAWLHSPVPETNVGAKTRQPLAKEKSCTSRISSTPPVYVLKPEQPFKRASSAQLHSPVPDKPLRTNEGHRDISASRMTNASDFPSLGDSSKMSKKDVKGLNAKARTKQRSKKCSVVAMSSHGVSIPPSHSKTYYEFECRLQTEKHILEEDLTPASYKDKFHHLLCWEELEHDEQLAKCNGTYTVHIYQSGFTPNGLSYWDEKRYPRFGCIVSDDGDTLVHIKQASEGSFIILENNSYVHARHVIAQVPKDVNFNAITIAFDEQQLKKLQSSELFERDSFIFIAEVKFELKHSYFQRLHYAVDQLPGHVILKLNPTVEQLSSPREEKAHYFRSPAPPYECLKLDQDVQMKALHVILNSTPEFPVLVAGPFGTGKTRMLARAAYDILGKKNSRVLICAHHHTSVDTFVEYFGAMKRDKNYPWLESLIRVIPNGSYTSNTKDRYEDVFKTISSISPRVLEDCRLVITTLGIAVKLHNKILGRRREFFTDILIDEGAQTREPETIGPLSLAGKHTRIVLAGDHCQVGPRLLVLGKEAQEHGLGVSLLERLHCIYDQADLPINTYSVTLLTNYRCHSGILMLPSSLFYQSTLRCRVPDSESHPDAPFPLAFVCSSMEQNTRNIPGVNEVEADVLLNEVVKYFKKWPKNWDQKDRKVCIMSPSANQCSKLRKKYARDLECDVRVHKAYDIQGTEFKAIFISTSEPTSEDGKCIYQTKSICDRYVFNTAITRSRALVVAVGNPFLLLNLEQQMVEKYGESARCWTPYIKQCIECKTFSYSEQLRKDSTKLLESTKALFGKIYHTSLSPSVATFKPLDSIIKSYKKAFERCRKTTNKVLLSCSKGRMSWKIEDDGEEHESEESTDDSHHLSDRYICVLDIDTYRSARAIPVDSSKRIVSIQGLANRRGSFDGDTVMVGVFEDCPPDEYYGRVLEVIKRGGNLKFVCRVSDSNSIAFCPIDRKNPILINLPRLSRDFFKKTEWDDISQADLKCNDVVVFEPPLELENDEGEEVPLPRIRQVIPFSVAKRNMLFLVTFVKWELKYRNPLGVVEGIYPKGFTPFYAERLLRFEHSVHYNDEVEEDQLAIPELVKEDAKLQLYSQVFTIDPEGAQNLDDALSLVKLQECTDDGHAVYQLGVHIVNAAKHIETDMGTDVVAKNLGVSVYGGSKGKVMHMLPSHKLRCQLSLSPGKIRDVISVTCWVTVDPSSSGRLTITKVSIQPAQVKSAAKLTYASAQRILEGDTPQDCVVDADSFKDLSLSRSMKLLYRIAFAMRQERLQSDSACAYDSSDPGEEHCWQSHLLVEELMIWANSAVAQRIHSGYPDAAMLRKQSSPNEEMTRKIVNDCRSIMVNSLHLSRYMGTPNGEASDSSPSPLLVTLDVLQKLKKAVDNGDCAYLTHLLCSDFRYPQLSAIDSELRSLSLRAEYCCTEENKTEPSEYRHDSLRLDSYTHFTSPMRRYVDIQVQRILLETLKETSFREDFQQEKHNELCVHLNTKARNSSMFEKKLGEVNLSFKLLSSSEAYTAFVVSGVNSNSVELQFPHLELRHFPRKAKKLMISNISSSFRITSLKQLDMGAVMLPLCMMKSNPDSDSSVSADGELKMYYVAGDSTESPLKPDDVEYSSLNIENCNFCFESLATEIPPDQWKEALDLVKSPAPILTAEKKARLSDIFKCPSHKAAPSHMDKSGGKLLFVDCVIKDPWKSLSILKVWLTWSMRDHMISPAVQLVEISPLFRFCIQHSSHPAECFSDPNLSQASKVSYQNISEYVDVWKKVLLAEAAEKSIKECKPLVIRDVSLNWPQLIIPKECVDEKYYVPSEAVKMVLPDNFVNDCSEFFKIWTGDLVCVRCDDGRPSGTKGVFHFVVHSNDEKERVVQMEYVGVLNCRISEEMKNMITSPRCYCEVQIMAMSVSYRKVFGGLLRLKKPSLYKLSQLSHNVAVNVDKLPGFFKHQNVKTLLQKSEKDIFATSISKWSNEADKDSTVLNEWQREAMTLALKKCFQLIQGPPGTGKSETGAHIAYVFAKHLNEPTECVLYCGPSNKSVDVVLEKFCALLRTGNQHLRILRIYSSSIVLKDYPGPLHSRTSSSDSAQCLDWAKPFSLHHMIRDLEKYDDIPQLRKFSVVEKMVNQLKLDNKIPSGSLCKEYRDLLKFAESAFLKKKKFDVVFCTCNEASSLRIKNLSPRQCIIDESGMAYEPETIVPLSLCEHAVLIGDHKQLQPVIDYNPAKKFGLSTSLFERYALTYGPRFTYTLRIQYRMHKEICEFPSKYFYDNQLITDESVINRTNPETKLEGFWPRGNRKPIMFVDFVGKEDTKTRRSEGETRVVVSSKSNTKEAEKVVEIVSVLHQRHQVAISELAVLTPYSAQKEKIKKIVQGKNGKLQNLQVVSISESQGNEFGIVILSTVRSQPVAKIRNRHIVQADHFWLNENLGFITDKHQINVGITRSKYGLVIIGNQTLLRYDDTWRELLDHYKDNGCVVNGKTFPAKPAR